MILSLDDSNSAKNNPRRVIPSPAIFVVQQKDKQTVGRRSCASQDRAHTCPAAAN